MTHLGRPLLLAATVAVAVAPPPAAGQVTGPRGLRDHSTCCAIGLPMLHELDGTFEPAPDPVLSRRRAPAPPAPASPLADETGTTASTPPIPGTDVFVRETQSAVTPERPAEPPVAEADEPEYPPLTLPTRKVQGHLDVGFEVLGGFRFKLTKAEAAAFAQGNAAAVAKVQTQIPEVIRQLDGRKVMLTGFMLPMKMEGALTTEFLLVANSMLCCYGVVPPMNQWVTVKMSRKGLKPQQDVPVQVFGTLRVQPRVENGALSAIYHLDATK